MQKFDSGKLVITHNANEALDKISVNTALARHFSGDWGELCKEDRALNEEALKNNERLLSVYEDTFGVKFWIITECDRSYTTVLLPEDY